MRIVYTEEKLTKYGSACLNKLLMILQMHQHESPAFELTVVMRGSNPATAVRQALKQLPEDTLLPLALLVDKLTGDGKYYDVKEGYKKDNGVRVLKKQTKLEVEDRVAASNEFALNLGRYSLDRGSLYSFDHVIVPANKPVVITQMCQYAVSASSTHACLIIDGLGSYTILEHLPIDLVGLLVNEALLDPKVQRSRYQVDKLIDALLDKKAPISDRIVAYGLESLKSDIDRNELHKYTLNNILDQLRSKEIVSDRQTSVNV